MKRGLWVRKGLMLALVACYSLAASAQEGEGEEERERHKVALFTGNSWIPKGRSFETGETQTVIAPVYGLEYAYRLNEKWFLGTYNDITLIRMAVENEEGVLLERDNALLLTVGGAYEVVPRLVLELSGGVETDKHETLRVGRFGIEYGIPLPKQWELGIAASYVNKDVYDVFSLGLVIGRLL